MIFLKIKKKYLSWAGILGFAFVLLFMLTVISGFWKDKHICTAEEKKVEICYDLYEPVCGCSAESCKTYSNNCVACSTPEVVYFTEHKC